MMKRFFVTVSHIEAVENAFFTVMTPATINKQMVASLVREARRNTSYKVEVSQVCVPNTLYKVCEDLFDLVDKVRELKLYKQVSSVVGKTVHKEFRKPITFTMSSVFRIESEISVYWQTNQDYTFFNVKTNEPDVFFNEKIMCASFSDAGYKVKKAASGSYYLPGNWKFVRHDERVLAILTETTITNVVVTKKVAI